MESNSGVLPSLSVNFFMKVTNLIKISPFISLSVCFCCSWKDLTQTRSRHVLVTYWPVIDWSIRRSLVNTSVHLGSEWTECVVSTTIRYTHFHWLIYKLKRSWMKVTRTCLKRGCVRSFHERQKQTMSEMKWLILIRLESRKMFLVWSWGFFVDLCVTFEHV